MVKEKLNILANLLDKIAIERGYEIWKQIEEYDNYTISSLGNVKNNKTGKILKPSFDTHGYYFINLYNNDRKKLCYIHRLVSSAFIKNPDNKPCVDHSDNVRTNNNVINLRWATRIENGRNALKRSDNTSGTKGVYFNKKLQKYCARIAIHKKRINLGYYDNLEEAKLARQTKAKELFGEYINICEQ